MDGTLPLTVTLDVSNTGKRSGLAVPQLYLGLPQPNPAVVQPPKQLRGVAKLMLKPGQTKRVRYRLDQRALSYWDVDSAGWKVAPGCYSVMAGASSGDVAHQARLAVDGGHCAGAVKAIRTQGVCKRSVLVHLRHVRRRIKSVTASVGGTRQRFNGRREAVRVVIGGAPKISTVRLAIRTTRGTVRMKRRFHTCPVGR